MIAFEIVLVAGSVIFAGIGMFFVGYIVRTSGRDRPHDPEAVRKFIETAPRHVNGVLMDEAEKGSP